MRVLCCCLFLAWTNAANACITHSFEGSSGRPTTPVSYLLERMKTEPTSKLSELDSQNDHRTANFAAIGQSKWEENYASQREILSGNYAAAITRLEAVELAEGGNHATASNLGTAYELAGDNETAHRWISTAVRRNAYSHQDTEWLHKKILEAKIALESDPRHLEANPIVPSSPSGDPDSAFSFTYDGNQVTRNDVWLALQFQLSERMFFVKPKDPVVADLLYSYARLHASAKVWGPAATLLELARDYGYQDRVDLESRLTEYQRLHRNETFRMWATGAVVAAIVLFLAYRFFWSLHRFDKLSQRRTSLKQLMQPNRGTP